MIASLGQAGASRFEHEEQGTAFAVAHEVGGEPGQWQGQDYETSRSQTASRD